MILFAVALLVEVVFHAQGEVECIRHLMTQCLEAEVAIRMAVKEMLLLVLGMTQLDLEMDLQEVRVEDPQIHSAVLEITILCNGDVG